MSNLLTPSGAVFAVLWYSVGTSLAQSDQLCGARCARFVIQRMESIDVDLFDLALDLGIEFSNREEDRPPGTSINRLQTVLDSRGLHTRVVFLQPWQKLSDSLVAIGHVQLPSSEGHYVVRDWVDGRSYIWDGELGYCDEIPFEAKSSGYWIVVSRTQLPASVVEVRLTVFVGGVLLVAVFPFVFVFRGILSWRKKR